jgi:hypothetical protein
MQINQQYRDLSIFLCILVTFLLLFVHYSVNIDDVQPSIHHNSPITSRQLLEVSFSDQGSRAKEFLQSVKSSVTSFMSDSSSMRMNGPSTDESAVSSNRLGNGKRSSRYNKRQRKPRYQDESSLQSSADSAEEDSSSSSTIISSSSSSTIKEWIPNIAGAFLQRHHDTSEELFIASNPKQQKQQQQQISDTSSNMKPMKKSAAATHNPLTITNPKTKSSSSLSTEQSDENYILVYQPILSSSSIAAKEKEEKMIGLSSHRIASQQLHLDNLTSSFPSPPLIAYHQPQRSGYQAPSHLYIPSLASINALKAGLQSYLTRNHDQQSHQLPAAWSKAYEKALPDLSKQKASFESDNLKLHLCNGVFEAYAASYLTTRQHMIEVQSENYNLTWVNCEMASFIHMKESNNFYRNPQGVGMIMQVSSASA